MNFNNKPSDFPSNANPAEQLARLQAMAAHPSYRGENSDYDGPEFNELTAQQEDELAGWNYPNM